MRALTLRTVACLLAVSLLPVAAAAGRDIHVSNIAGDDTFTGRVSQSVAGRSGPVRTIGKALRLAQAGDRIVVANTGQPYRESISLVGTRRSGYSQQPFSIEGNGATLDGSVAVPPEGSGGILSVVVAKPSPFL